MSYEMKLIIVMAGVLLALGVMCIREWVLMYRAERQLEAERCFHRGSRELRRTSHLSEDIQ